jgi:transketolase C-terminal domain/subunit
MSEKDRVRQTIIDMTMGQDISHKLKYDDKTRTIRTVTIEDHDPDGGMAVIPQDLEFAAMKGGN